MYVHIICCTLFVYLLYVSGCSSEYVKSRPLIYVYMYILYSNIACDVSYGVCYMYIIRGLGDMVTLCSYLCSVPGRTYILVRTIVFHSRFLSSHKCIRLTIERW